MRQLSPSIFVDERIKRVPLVTRLAFIGAICVADRNGRFWDDPAAFKEAVFPFDNDLNPDLQLDRLVMEGFLRRGSVRGTRFLAVTNWARYQPESDEPVLVEDGPGVWLDLPSSLRAQYSAYHGPVTCNVCAKLGQVQSVHHEAVFGGVIPAAELPMFVCVNCAETTKTVEVVTPTVLRSVYLPYEPELTLFEVTPIVPKISGKKKRAPKEGPTAEQVEEVWDHWLGSTGRTAKLTPPRKRIIERALEGYPMGDVKDAVCGWKSSSFHSGNNADGRVWNDIELLLRPAKIETFRDLTRGNLDGKRTLAADRNISSSGSSGIDESF